MPRAAWPKTTPGDNAKADANREVSLECTRGRRLGCGLRGFGALSRPSCSGSFRGYTAAVTTNNTFAVLLDESSLLRSRKQIKHGLGRAAQPYAERRNDSRPIDKDRMRHHAVKQLIVG